MIALTIYADIYLDPIRGFPKVELINILSIDLIYKSYFTLITNDITYQYFHNVASWLSKYIQIDVAYIRYNRRVDCKLPPDLLDNITPWDIPLTLSSFPTQVRGKSKTFPAVKIVIKPGLVIRTENVKD